MLPSLRPLSLAALTGVAALAAAPVPGTIRLEYERRPGAERCADRVAFESLIAAQLGRAPWSSDATRTVRVVLSRERRMLVATVDLLERDGALLGTRRLRSSAPDCRDLGDAVALAVTILLSPSFAIPDEAPTPAESGADSPPDTQ